MKLLTFLVILATLLLAALIPIIAANAAPIDRRPGVAPESAAPKTILDLFFEPEFNVAQNPTRPRSVFIPDARDPYPPPFVYPPDPYPAPPRSTAAPTPTLTPEPTDSGWVGRGEYVAHPTPTYGWIVYPPPNPYPNP